MKNLTRHDIPETVKTVLDTAIKTDTIDILDLYEISNEFGNDWDGLVNRLVGYAYADIHCDNSKHKAMCKVADQYYKEKREAEQKTEIVKLNNEKCWIEFNTEKKEVFGRDLTDHYNEPCFFNKTKRGINKAWEILKEKFSSNTTMHDVITILQDQNIRCHYYCAVD